MGESLAGEASLSVLEQLRVTEAPQGLGDLESDTHERLYGRHLDVKQETRGRVRELSDLDVCGDPRTFGAGITYRYDWGSGMADSVPVVMRFPR